ncbi:MAG: class I SAM-dependent methyltransferase [Calditrichaeota bacterium]|nr:MAG: class I SAM-dependent methyltransferase [Calditrichota bacterium]
MPAVSIARGKPADYGQLIVKRRFELTANLVDLSGKNILDFGCGNGAQTVEFAGSGCQISALDIDAGDLEIFNRYLTEHNISTISTSEYDGRYLPFADARFDIVVSYEVLEHVRDENQTLQEIYRTLKPGGKIVFSVPNKGWVFETHGAHLPFLPWNRIPFFSWLPHFVHKRFAKARIYRKKDIVKLLINNGFVIQSVQYITAPMDVVKNQRVQSFLRTYIFKNNSTMFSILATAILIHAKKPDQEN